MEADAVLNHPQNRLVIAGLLAVRFTYAQPDERPHLSAPSFTTQFSLSDLRTHPDLGAAAESAAQGLLHLSGLLMGYHVLAHPSGMLFAVCVSMSGLHLRVEPADVRGAAFLEGFGPGWAAVPPWDAAVLRPLMQQALDCAQTLAALPIS